MNITDKFFKFKQEKQEKIDEENKNQSSIDGKIISNEDALFKETKNNFSFGIVDENIWYMMESIYEIKKIKTLFKNYFKIQDKIININDFVQTFTNEKHEFISNMEVYLSKTQSKSPSKEYYLSNHAKMIYQEIVNLFKSSLDELFTSYKILKQKISKKKGIATKYWDSKVAFIQKKQLEFKDSKEKVDKLKNDNKSNLKDNVDKSMNNLKEYNKKADSDKKKYYDNNHIENQLSQLNDIPLFLEPPKETWVLKYLPQDTKTADETVNILNDLSNLVRTFSQKVYHQSEMTNQSKF